MKTPRIDHSAHDHDWFEAKDVFLERADFRDLDPVASVPRRRSRVVKAIGVLCLASVAVFAGWMAGTTPARHRIADWGTMGNAARPTLNQASPLAGELGAQRARLIDEVAESPTILWTMSPALAIPDPAREVRRYYSAADPNDPYASQPAIRPPSNQGDFDELVRQAADLL